MNLELAGKTALITGASRGIGRGIARYLAREGMKVAVTARDGAALETLAADIGPDCLIFPADLRAAAAPADFVARAADRFGRIDLVVANAGATKRADFFALTDADFADGFALKYFAHVRLVRAAWPHLVETAGSIVHIVGIGGKTPGAEFTIGGSVNAAILAFVKAMADRGVADGVRVCAVNPGAIATDRLKIRIEAHMNANGVDAETAAREMAAGLGVARFGTPDDIAAMVAFLASAPASYVQGAIIDVDGGATKSV